MLNFLLVVMLCLIWGSSWVVIKIGLSDAPPLLAAALRFSFAIVVLGGIVLLGRRPQPQGRVTWLRVLLPGVFMFTIPYSAVYYAAQFIPSALNSVLFSTFPFFVAVLAHFFLPDERLTWLKLLGLVIGFAGVVMIFHDGISVPEPKFVPAMLISLLSPASSAVAAIWLKKYLTRVDSVSAVFWQMLVGVSLLLPLGLSFDNVSDFHWTWVTISTAAFLGIFASALTFVTYLRLLKTEEATRLSLIAFVTPIVTLILGWLILGEQLGVEMLIGIALVLIGLYSVLILAPRQEEPQSD